MTDAERAERDEEIRRFLRAVGMEGRAELWIVMERLYSLGRKHGAREMRERAARVVESGVALPASAIRALDAESGGE